MDKELVRKLFRNKANDQVSITLPKKKVDFLRDGKPPKKVKIKIEELFWDD